MADWRDYYQVEPWGDNLLDRRLASLECSYANVHRNTDNFPGPFHIHQFAPYLEPPAPVEEDPEILSIQLTEMFKALNTAPRTTEE